MIRYLPFQPDVSKQWVEDVGSQFWISSEEFWI